MPNGYIKKGENEFFSFFLLGSLGVKSPLFRLIKVPLVRCFVTKGFFSKKTFILLKSLPAPSGRQTASFKYFYLIRGEPTLFYKSIVTKTLNTTLDKSAKKKAKSPGGVEKIK